MQSILFSQAKHKAQSDNDLSHLLRPSSSKYLLTNRAVVGEAVTGTFMQDKFPDVASVVNLARTSNPALGDLLGASLVGRLGDDGTLEALESVPANAASFALFAPLGSVDGKPTHISLVTSDGVSTSALLPENEVTYVIQACCSTIEVPAEGERGRLGAGNLLQRPDPGPKKKKKKSE